MHRGRHWEFWVTVDRSSTLTPLTLLTTAGAAIVVGAFWATHGPKPRASEISTPALTWVWRHIKMDNGAQYSGTYQFKLVAE